MVDYPYTLKPSTLEDFLKKIATRPEPPSKVSQEYLKTLGYTSSHDWSIIPILKFINFLDSGGNPSDFFKNFRDTRKAKAIMAQVLKESYKELFGAHANPCQASGDDLENFFRTKTGRGGRMLTATVATFKLLCTFADFGAPSVAITPTPTPMVTPAPSLQLPITREGGININVNIRLELPATQDATIYDKIFESLKKHLLTPSSKAD